MKAITSFYKHYKNLGFKDGSNAITKMGMKFYFLKKDFYFFFFEEGFWFFNNFSFLFFS